MRSGRTARRTAQSDDLPRLDPLVRLDEPFGEVAVIGLQSVVMADDDQVAIPPDGLRDAHAAAEGGIDRVAHAERQIDALMPPSAAQAELAARIDRTFVGIMESRGRVHERHDDRFGNVGFRDAAVREERLRVPVFFEDRAVLRHLAVADVFPRVVAEQDDVEGLVARIERVDHRQGFRVERRADLLALHAAAHVGHGIRGDLFGCARVGLRPPRLFGRGALLLFGAYGDALQRVDYGGLAGRDGAERIRSGFGGLQAGRTGGFPGVARRRGGGQRESGEQQQVFFHTRCFRCFIVFSVTLRRPPARGRTPRRSGGRSVRAAPCKPGYPASRRIRAPGRRPTSGGS